MDETQIVEMLKEHESRSQRRYESLKAEICGRGEGEMGEGINTDKVIVNAGSGGGEGGLGGLAAFLACEEGADAIELLIDSFKCYLDRYEKEHPKLQLPDAAI